MLAKRRGSRQPLSTVGIWAGTAGQDCAEPQGEQPELQRKLQERSKRTSPRMLPCTPLHPRTREQREVHTLSGWERGKGPRAPGLCKEHRDSSCRQALPDTLNTGRDHTRAARKSAGHPQCCPGLMPGHPPWCHMDNISPQPGAGQGDSWTGVPSCTPLNAAGVTGTRWASQH